VDPRGSFDLALSFHDFILSSLPMGADWGVSCIAWVAVGSLVSLLESTLSKY
jgi:hypothetical protein